MDTVTRSIAGSIATKQQILDTPELLETIRRVADVMVEALQHGRRILWCGNGGSAADAQHLAASTTACLFKRRALAAQRNGQLTGGLTGYAHVVRDIGHNYREFHLGLVILVHGLIQDQKRLMNLKITVPKLSIPQNSSPKTDTDTSVPMPICLMIPAQPTTL